MPIYKLNGDVYDIPQEKQGEFESQFPDAFISYTAGADQYDIPVSKRDDFLKDFPDAQLYSVSQPQIQETPIEDPYATTDAPMFDDEPQAAPAAENVEENSRKLRGLWANFKESSKGLWAGLKGYAGEQLNLFSGSSREEQAALNDIEQLEQQGIDVTQYLADKEKAEFQETYGMSKEEFMALDKKERRQLIEQVTDRMVTQQPILNEARLKEQKRQLTSQKSVEGAFRKALEAAGGDMTKAKAILREQAADKTKGDVLIEEATETMNNLREPEGFAGWVGNLLPQMIPATATLALNYLTKGKASGLSKAIGFGTMGGLTLSTAGMSMIEARNAGATNLEVWLTGIADGAIEIISEKIPFDRVTKRVFSSAKANVAKKLGDAVLNPKGRAELEKLLSDANEKLGGRLFSKKNVGEWLKDTAYEAAGEFTAEALQTITTMIYENPEDYPTISEVLANGWEGAKAGLFMGAITGGASHAVAHSMNKDRRQAQGYVDVAQMENEDGDVEVVEVVGEDPQTGNITILHNDELESVSREKIGDRFRFSYEEFENARLREMEDEAIESGNVTDGQIQGLEESISKDIEEIKALAPEMTESEISAILQSEMAVEPETPLGDAVAKYQEDVARHDELVAAKREADAAKKKAVRSEIETAVGQRFWVQESGEDDGSGIVPVSETVEEVVYADGRVGYVVGSDESGNLTMVYTDGTKGFSSRAEIADKMNSGEIVSDTPMGLEQYLEYKVSQNAVAAEQTRMAEEHALSVEEMIATHPQGSVINVGTEEAKIEVPVIAPPTKDGVIVQMPDGTTPMLTWEDVAHAEKKEITPKTDAQLNQSIVDEYRVAYTPAVPDSSQPTQQQEAQVKRTSPANPLPLKADGSVDQTALWNKDPEGWAQWNDEKRQDGGADSLAYVTNAIAVEQAKMAELQTARSQETDFDRRDALDAEIATAQERINRLVAIQQGYLAQPAVADAVQNVQPEPQTEEEKAKAEDQRREPLRKRAKEFGEKLGVKVNIAESLADVKEEQAREEILGAEVSGSGARFPGWYDRETGEVTIYLPHVRGVADIDRTIVHEVVAHKGLRGLLGKEGYNVLCDAVWDMMTEAERAKYMAYPGVDGDKRLAADEYIARFAEGLDLEQSRPIWNKIAEAVQKILNSMGIRLEVTKEDLADLIAASYMRLQEQARAAQTENAPVVEEVTEEIVPETTIEQQTETGADVEAGVEADIEEVTEESTSPIIAAAQQDKGGISFNVTTEEPLQDKIRKFAQTEEGKATGWTEDDIESIIAETESLIDAIHRSSTGNEFYDEFAYKEPTIRVDWRDGEAKPIVTWTRANIEYKYDMSADLLCINNEGLEKVLSSDKMVALMEMFVPEKKAKKGEPEIKFTSEDYLELYNTLKDLGFVVPCKGCFDAAGRFKMLPSVAQKFAAEVNALIDERNKDPKAFDEKLKAKPGEKTVGGLPATAATKSAAIAAGVAGDNLTEHVKWTQLMSADGQTKMLSDWGGIFRAWQRTGAGRPKDKLLPEPYYGDIVSSVSTIIGKYGEKTPSFRDTLVNQGTGLRRNSHSEFRPVLAIDEIQFMRDAFIRNLTVFKYMKELDDVRLFGKMGVKFNMSFFPEYVPGTKVAGLDKDGNYIASEESVGSREFSYQGEDGKRHYDGMKGWEEAQKHINKDVSLSSVIFSIPHLLKALTDVPTPSDMRGIWGSLIPFHSSGATTASLAMQGLGMARANGVGHGFSEAFYDYGKGVTNFEAVQNDRFGEGWHIVSGTKAGTDVEPGHKLEFVNGNHYYNKALGVHLFASGYILDSELPAGVLGENGELDITNDQKKDLIHKFTIDYNDKVRELKGPYAYKDAADFYIAELPKLGLIPRFDFEVSEEKFLEMCEAANVDPRHPKLGWKGEGNSWSPIDSEAYYSLFCDYGMTDPATGEWAPHMPVGYVNEKGEREFRLPDNAVEIVKEGLDRFSEVRRSENARIDEAIEAFAQRSVEKGRISQKSVDKVLGKKPVPAKPAKPKKSGVIDLVEEAKKAVEKIDAKGDVSFRITPEQDKDYMAAVEAGDMETAQRMVNEAAKLAMPNTKVVDENGNPKVVYHGSTAMFTVFDKSRIGSATGTADGRGFYFTTDRDYALGYKTSDGQLFEVFLNIEKPLSYDKKTITKAQLRKILKEADRVEYEQEGEHYMLSNYANYNNVGIDAAVNEAANLEYDYADNDVELVGSLIGGSGSFDLIMDAVKKVTGKSGMIAPKDNGTIHYVVTDPTGIKTAEPVTYDNDGNVIRLSERFNPKNEDIRFRMRTEEEDAMEFTQQVINDCTSRYNEVAEVQVFPENEETAKRFGYTMEELKEIGGTYVKEEDIIAIFASKDRNDSLTIENIFFHESIHKLAEFYPEFKKIGEWMWDNSDIIGLQKIRNHIENGYDSEWYSEEMLTYGIAGAMSLGVADRLESTLPEELQGDYRAILNEIGYEPGKESRRTESRVSESTRRGTHGVERKADESGRSKKEEARTGELTAEERRIIGEYFPEFNKSEEEVMKAPNGKDSKLTKDQWNLVRSEEFIDWFGDWINDPENASKVVDSETGEPMVVYHGTAGTINEFQDQQRSPGFWFVDREDVANGYAESASAEFGEEKNVIPVFLNTRNPRIEDAHAEYPAEFALKSYVENDNGVYVEFDTYEQAEAYRKENVPDGWVGASKVGDQHDLVEWARERGNDGVIIKNVYDQAANAETGVSGTQTNYVVLRGNQIKLTSNENPTESSDIRFRTSLELDEEFGDAWRNQQNEDGRHSTQVANTKSTYEKIGHYLEDAGMKGASILDASSGLGLGTQALREMGFQVDDVEPFPSENREAPTFSSYADIDKQYDVVISNAVLNVIPDDWRADVLHQMADAVKEGGKMIINTRPASNIAQQGVEGKTRITLDSPSEILVKRGDRIAAYQKGFTSEELAEWIKSELGEGWRVEKATKKNSGISGEGTAVVIKEGDNVSFRVTGTPADEVVANGLTLTPAQTAEVAANIFAALPEESRKKITEGLNGNILGLKDAILQIPASLAIKENWNEEDRAMADVVAEEMTKMAGEMTRPFSAPEALWLLYNNLNKGNDLISQASRALVQRNLGFDEETLERQEEAKQGVSFRMVGDATANAKASMYNRGAVNVWTRLKESFVDMQASVEELVSAIEKATGKVAKGFENILLALNQQPSKGLAAMESYEQRFLMPMFDEIRKIMDKAYAGYDTVVRYVILKHGLERNKKLAQRDAKAHYQEIYDEMIAKVNSMDDSQKRTYLTNAQLQDADAKAKLATLKAADTSAYTEEEKNAHKSELAKAKEEVKKAKENLERAQKINSMSEQELKDELDKIFEKIENGTDSVYKELRKNDYSGISSMFYDQLGVNRKDFSTEEEYQAALMLAKNDRFSSLEEVEAQAEGEVSSFEGRVDTKELWKRINAATKETLRQQYEANMISKDQYESLRNMFEYYVPLRGFKDNTAEDMYTYYRKPNSTGYTKPILGAEGRKTEAESPFGWIAAMAGSAIASNVKNEAKLALYYFVSNRPNNGIATLSRTWFVHTPGDVDANGKKIFKPAYPPFSEDLSSDAAKQAYEDWQEQMRELQKQGLAYEAGQRLNLGNAVVNISDANKPEHVVTVKVAGKDYTIVINGNPRAAQAINGELNLEGTADDYSAIFGPVLRWMSSVNTSYNPEFWITNLMRDMAFTWMAVNTKEDPAYRKKFSKNYWKCFRVIGLVAKNEKGTIGNSYIEDMYKDFVKYGGVTGYTQIKDSETWEKEIDNYLRSTSPESLKNGKMMRGMKTFFHAAHRFGESLEQVSRFAAFLTSREMGKTINEAIADAKEITVNFNRKGSGKMITLEESKYLTDKNGQPLSLPARWAAVGLSSIAPLGRRTIMFFNAAVQGLNSVYRLWKKNPKRLAGWTAAYFAIGVMNAALHAMLDDDDDYLDIPQYERRNSLMLGGNGAYLKWALPQEARAFYALGDLAVETVLGRNPHQNVVGEAMKIATEVLPVNPSEGWKAFVPSVAIPAVELMLNEDYKGDPIYNEQKWLSKEERERTAKWSSAYQGTGAMYKGIAQGLNYITGGDKHDAGMINLQPEKMEHLVQSAFGGTIRTADKFINTIWAMFDPEEDVTVRQTPFLNRILTLNDERFKNVHVNEVFDYYKADADHALTLEKKYRKDRDQESLNELRRSDEYQWAKVYRKYKKALDNLKEKLKVAEGTAERKELMRQQDELKRRVIKEISEL